MGLLDGIFGSDKPTQKNIEKLVIRVKERYAQPEYRREAMERLLGWNTPEAIIGALARFTVVAQSPHWACCTARPEAGSVRVRNLRS